MQLLAQNSAHAVVPNRIQWLTETERQKRYKAGGGNQERKRPEILCHVFIVESSDCLVVVVSLQNPRINRSRSESLYGLVM